MPAQHPFDAWWAGSGFGEVAGDSVRAIAQAAWDNALCAASARNFDEQQKLRPAIEIAEHISRLHTWIKPA